MATKREQIISEALNLIASEPDGIRYIDLRRNLEDRLPHIKSNYIHSIIVNLDQPEIFYKPKRGLFRHVRYREAEKVGSEVVLDKLVEIKSLCNSYIANDRKNLLIPIQYHNKEYPYHIKPRITEVAAHFDIKKIRKDGLLSIHTEYSYTRRRLDSNLSHYPSLRSAHRDCVPKLWFDRQWSIEFAEFLKNFVGNKKAVVIEIHPPFNDYSTIDTFLDNYKEFEEIIFDKWPDMKIVLENRSGTEYSGGRFLISNSDDLKKIINKIGQTPLRLDIALDIPQLFTAHGGPENFNNDGIKEFLLSLSPLMYRVQSIHLWGKKRKVPHVGDLNDYFNHDHSKKRVFLSTLAELLDDGRTRYFVPEVNSPSEHLQSIVTDLESAGINFL